MNFLAEPPRWLYLLLFLAAALPLVAAFVLAPKPEPRNERGKKPSTREWLIVAGIVALLLLIGLRVCDYLIESDREQITRKLNEMSEGVQQRDMNKVFQHISESFHIQGADKAAMRRAAESQQAANNVNELKIWDIDIESISHESKLAAVRFQFKVEGAWNRDGATFFRCKSQFVLEGKEWRLKSFEVFPPTGDANSAISIPGL